MFASSSKSETIKLLNDQIKKVLEPCLIKNNENPSPYIIQLELLAGILKTYGIKEPSVKLESIKNTIKGNWSL